MSRPDEESTLPPSKPNHERRPSYPEAAPGGTLLDRCVADSDLLETALFANVSRELRTPLNAVIGFTELLNLLDRLKLPRRYVPS